MLDLLNVDDQVRLECDVVGYQFPDQPNDDWCLIRVDVRQGDESFEKIDAALTASEVVSIRDWFRCLAGERLPRWAHLQFTEPCLGFQFLAMEDAGVRIAVHLNDRLRPPFRLKQLRLETEEWQVVFLLDGEDLARVIERVESQIQTHPVRTAKS